jgi:hypothetical protein
MSCDPFSPNFIEVWGHVTTNGQSVNMSWDFRPGINSVWILLSCLCWEPSLTRGWVCLLSVTVSNNCPSSRCFRLFFFFFILYATRFICIKYLQGLVSPGSVQQIMLHHLYIQVYLVCRSWTNIHPDLALRPMRSIVLQSKRYETEEGSGLPVSHVLQHPGLLPWLEYAGWRGEKNGTWKWLDCLQRSWGRCVLEGVKAKDWTKWVNKIERIPEGVCVDDDSPDEKCDG